MKNCCLWIGGEKVSDLAGIKKNFCITDVKGYYLGGRLADWLRAHGADREAQLVEAIDKNGDVDTALEDIFKDKPAKDVFTAYQFNNVTPPFLASGNGAGLSPNGSFGGYGSMSGSFGSFRAAGSFKVGSFGVGSYRHSHEYEYEYRNGSYKKTSFTATSFGYGSFGFGSFKYGSFNLSSFIFGSFSYEDLCEGGSFTPAALMLFFSSEPLNRFGYGIHLI